MISYFTCQNLSFHNIGVFNSEDLAQSMFMQQYDGRLSLNDVLHLREVARTA